MKYFLFLALFGSALSFTEPAQAVRIEQALENAWIDLEVYGNPESTHYLKPIIVAITNSSDRRLEVTIPAGQTFLAKDPTVQDVIVTEETLIALDPGKTTQLPKGQ